ncbi:MAG: PDZ domain-containing protein [Acidiferrobacterales bacterium]|nr:PDZ domain-containing protein [Acidiferrobacterales bacterium]
MSLLTPVAPSYGLVVLVLTLYVWPLPALAEARLGMYVDRVPDITANAHDLAPNTGAHIVSVVSRGPAARAGLRAGDIILRINEKLIRDPEDVTAIAKGLTPGQDVPVEIMRDGNLMQLYLQPSP